MWEKILVPVDSSATTQMVFEKAVSLAKSTGASLSILHVLSMDDPEAPPPAAFTGQYTRNRVTGEYSTKEAVIEQRKQQWENFEKKRFNFLRTLKDEAAKQNISTEIVQISGNPGPTICQQAEQREADLIIMGNRGISAIEKIVLGSVSSYVVQNSSCSVLIARIPENKALNWQKILVAVDSSAIAKNAFDCALDLAKATGAVLQIVKVLSVDDLKALQKMKNKSLEGMAMGGLESFNDAMEEMRNEALEAMKDETLITLKNEALAKDVKAETIQVLGSPGRSICEQAELAEVNLIVMGSRGLSGLKKLFLGSVSSYVINNAYCSVLVSRGANE